MHTFSICPAYRTSHLAAVGPGRSDGVAASAAGAKLAPARLATGSETDGRAPAGPFRNQPKL